MACLFQLHNSLHRKRPRHTPKLSNSTSSGRKCLPLSFSLHPLTEKLVLGTHFATSESSTSRNLRGARAKHDNWAQFPPSTPRYFCSLSVSHKTRCNFQRHFVKTNFGSASMALLRGNDGCRLTFPQRTGRMVETLKFLVLETVS